MNALTKTSAQSPSRFSPDQVELIKRTVCRGGTDDELSMFMYQADKTGLDPLARQIYAVKRWDGQQKREVMGIQVSIDGFRLIAERSGQYAGQVGPYWCGQDGKWVDVWVATEAPAAARVGVLRHDFKEPCWGVARFSAYAQTKREGGYTVMWHKMGDVMIAKCAEALALRKAFPQELSGLYTGDEMSQAENVESAPHSAPARLTPPSPPAAPVGLSEEETRRLDRESMRQMRGETIDAEVEEEELPPAPKVKITPQEWGNGAIEAIVAMSAPELDLWRDKNDAALNALRSKDAGLHKQVVEAIRDRFLALEPMNAG